MYKRIVVALDQSSRRFVLMEKAIGLAKAMDARLMLVHALSVYDDGSPGLPVRTYQSYYPTVDNLAWETYQTQWRSYEQAGLDDLQQLVENATAMGVKTKFTQAAGDPGRIVCEVAQSYRADLILIGNRGRAGLSELLLGSVSNYVMHHAPCSVLVVREEESAPSPPQNSDEAIAKGELETESELSTSP